MLCIQELFIDDITPCLSFILPKFPAISLFWHFINIELCIGVVLQEQLGKVELFSSIKWPNQVIASSSDNLLTAFKPIRLCIYSQICRSSNWECIQVRLYQACDITRPSGRPSPCLVTLGEAAHRLPLPCVSYRLAKALPTFQTWLFRGGTELIGGTRARCP